MENITNMFSIRGGDRANTRTQGGRNDGNTGNITNMFSTRGGSCANDTTQGGLNDGNTEVTMGQRCTSVGSISGNWEDASAPYRDDPSAPNVGAHLGERGNKQQGN